MRIDAVFSGGGVKAYAYLGVLESIHNHQLQLERVAGTSAGAIVSALVAARYSYQEIQQLINELDVRLFMDPPLLTKYLPFMKWPLLYFQMGIYKGDRLEEWLTEKLEAKNIRTFKDIEEGYLKIIASDLTLGRLVVFPDDLMSFYGLHPNQFPIAKAVRMSAGFPFFFMPKKLPGKSKNKSIIVDGGLLSNFPLWIYGRKKQQLRPVLGVKLTEVTGEVNETQTITNAFGMFYALFLTMKKAHDMRYISKAEENNILFIPVEDLAATDFNISEQKKSELSSVGKYKADEFLSRWPC